MASFHKSLFAAVTALALVAPSLAEAKAKPGPRSHAAKAAKKPRAARTQTATVQAQGTVLNPSEAQANGPQVGPSVVGQVGNTSSGAASSGTNPTQRSSGPNGLTGDVFEGTGI